MQPLVEQRHDDETTILLLLHVPIQVKGLGRLHARGIGDLEIGLAYADTEIVGPRSLNFPVDVGDHPVESQAGFVRHVLGDPGDNKVSANTTPPQQQRLAHGIVGAEQPLRQPLRQHDRVRRVEHRARITRDQREAEQLKEAGVGEPSLRRDLLPPIAQQPVLVFRTDRAQHRGECGHHLRAETSRHRRKGLPFPGWTRLADLVDLLALGVEAIPRQCPIHVQADENGDREGRGQPTHVDRGVHPIAAQIAPSDDQVIAQHGQCLLLG